MLMVQNIDVSILYFSSIDIIKTRDRGANGGLAEDDVRIINKTSYTVNVQGIDSHQCINMSILTAGAITRSQRGSVVIIMNQYAYIVEAILYIHLDKWKLFKNDVNDKSIKVLRGAQYITTSDDNSFPLNIKSGLPYMNI